MPKERGLSKITEFSKSPENCDTQAVADVSATYILTNYNNEVQFLSSSLCGLIFHRLHVFKIVLDATEKDGPCRYVVVKCNSLCIFMFM